MTEYDKMFYSARMDELTQMLNRRGGNERLAQTIEQAERENQILTLVLYDINELKRVNDQYGHSAGDALLRYVASITKEGLGRMDFMFRLSGDEFVMLFYGRSKSEVEESMKRILMRASQDREHLDVDYGVPFSYGLTEIYPGENSSIDEIIARADEQMYIQKRDYHIGRAREALKEGKERNAGQAVFLIMTARHFTRPFQPAPRITFLWVIWAQECSIIPRPWWMSSDCRARW